MFSYLLPIVIFYAFYEAKEYKIDNNILLLSINLFFLISALILSYLIQFNIIDLPGIATFVNYIGEKVLSTLS